MPITLYTKATLMAIGRTITAENVANRFDNAQREHKRFAVKWHRNVLIVTTRETRAMGRGNYEHADAYRQLICVCTPAEEGMQLRCRYILRPGYVLKGVRVYVLWWLFLSLVSGSPLALYPSILWLAIIGGASWFIVMHELSFKEENEGILLDAIKELLQAEVMTPP